MKSTGDQIDTRMRGRQHAMDGEEGKSISLGIGEQKGCLYGSPLGQQPGVVQPHTLTSVWGSLVVF